MANSNPTASYTKIVEVPAEPLWEILQDFGNWNKWWPLFLTMELFQIGPNGERVIINSPPLNGDFYYRRFTSIEGITYEEKLTAADKNNYFLRYDLAKMEPPVSAVSSIYTTITLEIIDAKHTKIVWSSWTTLVEGTDPSLLQQLTPQQEKAYKKGVQSAVQYVTLRDVWSGGLDLLQQKINDMSKALLVGQSPTWSYIEPFPGKPFPKCIKGLPMSEVLPPLKVGEMLGRFLQIAYLQTAELVFDTSEKLPPGTDLYKVSALQIAQKYGKKEDLEIANHITSHIDDDADFCQQLLSGANPLKIKMVKNTTELPLKMTELKAQGLTIQELIDSKRLFILDYAELKDLKLNGILYFYAPIVLVYKEVKPGQRDQLKILAIQLERKPDAPLYTPNSKFPERYRLAKYFVRNADNQVHEFVFHLGYSHLGIEPIIIATHNQLKPEHPIFKILKPHMEETIGINFLARQTLISNVAAFTEKTFSVGTKQGIEMVSDFWGKYDFYRNSFPEDLKSRGFDREGGDGVIDYFYRDDGFLLWDTIGTYVTNYVDEFYSNDKEVENDKDLQSWAQEVADPKRAGIPGFKSSIPSKKELVHILQIIIWNGSALHSFLNFPQWPYVGYLPNRPNGMYLPMDDASESDLSPKYLQKALAPQFGAAFQLTFSWLLSLPSETNLLKLGEKIRSETKAGAIFYNDLLKVTETINNRNQERRALGKAPYIYLLPENVAASCDI